MADEQEDSSAADARPLLKPSTTHLISQRVAPVRQPKNSAGIKRGEEHDFGTPRTGRG